MVQKKVPPKLPLQVDHVAVNNKQFHSHDFKNTKGPDLKTKRMKKTGPTKTQELAKKPGKMGPAEPPVCLATTPNYMKSTTSSDARREVSTKGPDHDLNMKIPKNLKLTLSSANKHKATKTKTKTKTVRTLTKNPSFKPARAYSSAIKCSRVVLCENLQAQRETCSSTLKHSKFPAYLSLNPGGTESEGTSVMKVCPYTYCSLNGHHHPPLPQLKCFLAARRCSIKAQKSLKLRCLSPRRAKGGVVKDGPAEDEEIGVSDNLEEHEDFFVEIFSGKNKDSGNKSGIIERGEMEGGKEEIFLEKNCEVDTKETLDQEGDVILMGGKVEEGVFSPLLVEGTREGIVSELSGESMMDDVKLLESDSEASDMEWEKGYHSVLYLDFDYECKKEMELDDPEAGKGFESRITNAESIIENTSHKIVCFDEFSADELSQESIDGDKMFNPEAFSNSDDGNESTDSYNSIKSSNPNEVPAEEQDDMTNNLMLSQNFPDESHIQNQEKPIENFTISSPIHDQAKESQSKVPQMMQSKFKSENKSQTTNTEDGHPILATIKSERPTNDKDESGPFNPRAPNFLPLEPDPEAERVDLKHQDLDDRKNAEEWMVDYALRQAVTRLGPERKRKVALLVEAFEKVMPVNKCELYLGHATGFGQTRPMQACN